MTRRVARPLLGQGGRLDTRLNGPAALTGRASKGVSRSLRARVDMVAEPESFLVTKQDRLVPEEASRARVWGTKLAAGISSTVGGHSAR